MNGITRRALIAGAVLAASSRLVRAGATGGAASAVSLLRPAVPERDARGLILRDADDRAITLASYAGRPVILNLWAPWCLPCRREMPSLARLNAALDGARVALVPLAFDWRGASGVRRFYAEEGIEGMPLLMGEGDNLASVLGIENLPTTAVIDAGGRMVQLIAGEAHWDDPATIAWARAL